MRVWPPLARERVLRWGSASRTGCLAVFPRRRFARGLLCRRGRRLETVWWLAVGILFPVTAHSARSELCEAGRRSPLESEGALWPYLGWRAHAKKRPPRATSAQIYSLHVSHSQPRPCPFLGSARVGIFRKRTGGDAEASPSYATRPSRPWGRPESSRAQTGAAETEISLFWQGFRQFLPTLASFLANLAEFDPFSDCHLPLGA
jgi:hypothetical protein